MVLHDDGAEDSVDIVPRGEGSGYGERTVVFANFLVSPLLGSEGGGGVSYHGFHSRWSLHPWQHDSAALSALKPCRIPLSPVEAVTDWFVASGPLLDCADMDCADMDCADMVCRYGLLA